MDHSQRFINRRGCLSHQQHIFTCVHHVITACHALNSDPSYRYGMSVCTCNCSCGCLRIDRERCDRFLRILQRLCTTRYLPCRQVAEEGRMLVVFSVPFLDVCLESWNGRSQVACYDMCCTRPGHPTRGTDQQAHPRSSFSILCSFHLSHETTPERDVV